MKSFLSRQYHWILLGVAVLLVVASAVFLWMQSVDLRDSLHTGGSAAAKSQPVAGTNAVAALNRLTNPVLWNPRADGASPFVSRPYILKEGRLVDPMAGSEPLYPPVPNQWLVDHGLDYADMGILDRDPLHKGFTVLQEFQAGTDPSNPNIFPPLHTRLSFTDTDVKKSSYLLEFMGDENNDGKKEYQIRPLQPLPNPDKGGRPDTSTRNVAAGSVIPGAPFLKVIGSTEKKATVNDTEYDASELTLENTVTGEQINLVKKYPAKDYKPKTIELVEAITLHYQLAGVPEETVTVERGKEFPLTTLDRKHSETYRFADFTKDGVLLVKAGKSFVIKPSQAGISTTPDPLSTP